ncbi:MAG: Ppx/GppA phosphatase family protein [Planctomycetota bacterium]|jgi:exopolyphosphatase/guanosine-5'-triphosphate,3'-diphosphate pyrophosphatase
MKPDDSPSEDSAAAKTVAAIDVGSNSLRMAIAEVLPDGRIEILEQLRRAVSLGRDTFVRGRLGGQSMRAALAVLRDYRQMLRLYNVERVRAVATSAVREASNADTFLDRIFMATDLQVEVIDTSQESRLTVSAVRQAVGDALGINRDETLIADVGGGSTLLTVLHDGEIAAAQSLRLGSIRLQEVLSTSGEPPQRSAALLHQQILNETATLRRSFPLENVESFVAVGGDARFAAREIGQPDTAAALVTVDRAELDKLVRRCQQQTAEDLSKRHGLPFAEAETLVPALLVYQILLHKTLARRMIVSQVSIRDGLLLDLARDATGQEDQALLDGVIHSAMAITEKYGASLEHAQDVADLAVALFDQLQADHGLGARHRLLLRVAGLLHEVGSVVSNRAHHKHSYYLISNSEVFGLNRDETMIVAHIARYHRRGMPKPSHVEYMALPRKTRVVINKLAALLRMADALARGHLRRVSDLRFERQGDELVVYVPGGVDLLLERKAIANKGDLFEDIYGMNVRLEEV